MDYFKFFGHVHGHLHAAEDYAKLPFDHHYKAAVNNLQESGHWIDNPQVKAWLRSKWLHAEPRGMLIYMYILIRFIVCCFTVVGKIIQKPRISCCC